MVFNNPAGATIEGRIPRKEDNFSEDRYYSTIERVFVRFDPYKDYIQVTFPCESGILLKYSYEKLNEIAKNEVTLIDLIKNANDVEEVSTTPIYGSLKFSEEKEVYVVFNEHR